MNRRQFLALSTTGAAALVLAEAFPGFDALPIAPASIGISGPVGHTAYVIAFTFASLSSQRERATLWITNGKQRHALLVALVEPDTYFRSDLPIVLRPTDRLVVDGNVRSEFVLAWNEAPARAMNISYIESDI